MKIRNYKLKILTAASRQSGQVLFEILLAVAVIIGVAAVSMQLSQMSLQSADVAGDRTVVDCLEKPLAEAMKILSIVGLSDVFAMVNVPARLSEGQGYRFRLAMAMASGKGIIFGDEFCSNLDRVTAAVIAFGVRKFARKYGVTFVLASSHDDLVGDLEPDVLVVRRLDGSSEVVVKHCCGLRVTG